MLGLGCPEMGYHQQNAESKFYGILELVFRMSVCLDGTVRVSSIPGIRIAPDCNAM